MSCFCYELEWIQGYSLNNVTFTHSGVFQRRRERGGVAGSLLVIVPRVKEKRLRKSQQISRYLSGLWLMCVMHAGVHVCVWNLLFMCVYVGGLMHELGAGCFLYSC